MPFKTKEEMFGDGGGFGAAVPFSTSNPAGTSAGNRGIQFGEALTAAIANRTHYALALNDEDLNTRLAAFETGGLSGAYDNGSVGPSGGGREITKDSGAVETISSLTTQYGDDIANAHYRINALGDSGRGGGLDARMLATQTAYALMARRNLALSAGGSTLAVSQAGTLNPSSVGGAVVRVGASTAHTAGVTGVGLLGMDFVEVTGAAVGVSGLYLIHSLGAANTDFVVRRLDGTTPSFTADTAVTVRFFRACTIADYNMGGAGTAGTAALAISGNTTDAQVLALFSNDVNGTVGVGAADALRVFSRSTAGVLSSPMKITGVGQLRSTMSGALWASSARDSEMRLQGGIVGIKDDRTAAVAGTHEVGMVFKDLAAVTSSRSALENWQVITDSASGLTAVCNGAFDTPSGRIQFTDTSDPPGTVDKNDWMRAVLPGVDLIEMLTGARAGEHFLVSTYELSGEGPVADEFTVTDLDGGSAGLPTSGAFTFRFIKRDIVGYKSADLLLNQTPETNDAIEAVGPARYGHILRSQRREAGSAPYTRAVGFVGDLAGISWADDGQQGLKEGWTIKSDGTVYFRSYRIPTETVILDHSIAEGKSDTTSGGNGYWNYDSVNNWWEANSASRTLVFPLKVAGRIMTSEIQVFFANTGSHSIDFSLVEIAPNWGSPSSAPTVTVLTTNSAAATNTWQEISLTHDDGSELGDFVNFSGARYELRLVGGAIGDRVRALRSTWNFDRIGYGAVGG